MTDLISRDKVHEFIAVALSDYITDKERETLETLDVDVANIPTIQAVPIEVLDKIKTEIQYVEPKDACTAAYATAFFDGLLRALQIIDKYKAERSDKE